MVRLVQLAVFVYAVWVAVYVGSAVADRVNTTFRHAAVTFGRVNH